MSMFNLVFSKISPSSTKTMKARPLTRALDKKVIPPLLCDDDFKRVTRRNSTIDRNGTLFRILNLLRSSNTMVYKTNGFLFYRIFIAALC